MNILGISGWKDIHKYFPETEVLPLHDAAAALIIDGKIKAAAEEERFTRQKHGYNCFPINATTFCLNKTRLDLKDIDKVAIYWDMPLSAKLKNKSWNISDKELSDIIFPNAIFGNYKRFKLEFINHHFAHALSAYSCSNFDKALVLVIDGQGEKDSTTIWKAQDGLLTKLREMNSKVSLGFFYEAITEYVGLESNEPGKTMALASYGEPIIPFDNFFKIQDGMIMLKNPDLIDMKRDFDEQQQTRDYWFKQFSNYIKEPNKTSTFSNEYINLAASGQRILEDIVTNLVEWSIKETGIQNICIAGGVGLNCVMNGKILQHELVKDLFIQPIAHDAGCALGAAIASSGLNKLSFSHNYLGPEYSNEEIKKDLDMFKINYTYHDNIEKKTAELLREGFIIGWFQGRMEMGPRALGNRSILANPIIKNISDIVNNSIKFREKWRPFAPSILEEFKEDYLVNAVNSPYMMLNFMVPKSAQKKIPGVLHIDNSVRAQTVSKSINSKYWNIINEFYKISGIPAVLNTSFNIKGEPIVCTPKDAIRTFYSSGLDYLTIGNYLVAKK